MNQNPRKEKLFFLADLIRPLVEKEAQGLTKIPASREVVEDLIKRAGTQLVQKANGPNPEWLDLKYLNTWLTRACQNAEDPIRGRMNIRSEIRDIISKCIHDEKDS
uniref:Orf105a n=1 Tax=Batis maritima TaxID=4436 RepID=A0A068BF63_BATMA|nr:orf105a [Batis maritima]AIC83344.1 orf105a [Batis maritima]